MLALSTIARLAGFVVSPIGSFISVVLQFLASPIGRVLVYALLVVGAYGVGDIRGRVFEHRSMVAHEKQEVANAVAEANAARDAADKKFVGGQFNNRPGLVPWRVHHGSDGFARD